MLINGLTFHWKDQKKGGPEHLGDRRQDVEKVFPQAVDEVSETTLGRAKTVDYAVLVAPMIEAMRELKGANDNLMFKTTGLQAEFKAANDNHLKDRADLDRVMKELQDLKNGVGKRAMGQ